MVRMENNYKYASLFGGEAVAESEKARVIEEVRKIGSLTFVIQKDEEGWSAQCQEMPALIAGNTNSNPTDIEIHSEIRSAIFAAFDVKVEQVSPYQEGFKYAAA